MFKYTGAVVKVGDLQKVSEKFAKRELVLTDGAASYPQMIAFQFTQKNCELLEVCRVGDQVEVTFGLKGREYNGKYFTNLDGFRLNVLNSKGRGNSSPAFEPQQESDLPF